MIYFENCLSRYFHTKMQISSQGFILCVFIFARKIKEDVVYDGGMRQDINTDGS